ncbi:MAG TPA: hypothetical protein PKD55_13650 [Bellilinea sp.]|nr:hypothetical protein [Bellilinea sp.]
MEPKNMIIDSIRIKKPQSAVWRVVSQPGWWLNDGKWNEKSILSEGPVTVVHAEDLGDFNIEVELIEKPDYAKFSWYSAQIENEHQGFKTSVEFSLQPISAEETELTVVETGFTENTSPPEVQAENYHLNVEGWRFDLELIKKLLEAGELT